MVSDMRIKRLLGACWALILAALLLPGTAFAQAGVCGISGSATATAAIYDPFNPTGLGTTNITLSLTRVNPAGGGKTSTVRFYLRAPNNGADGTSIVPLSAAGSVNIAGTGLNIFYDFATPGPTLSGSPTAGNRFLQVDFTGNNDASDTVQVTFAVTLPANLNVNASTTLAFNAIYTCNGTGGGQPFSGSGTIPNAVSFPIRVLSGLQASFVGPALDFGEVGDKTDLDAASINRSGNIRVASSGPYSVSMVSTRGYRMTYSGGNEATETQNLRYSVTFLGQTRDPSNTAAITLTCTRAGLGSPPLAGGVLLPVQVQLLEGGIDETPSPTYSDTLEVTLSPLVATTPGVTCPV